MSRTIASDYSKEWEDFTVTGGPPLYDGGEGCLLLIIFVAVFAFAFTHCSPPPSNPPHNPPCQTAP